MASPLPRSRSRSRERVAAPTLGPQIGPHYAHEQWPYNSDSSESDSENGEPTEGAHGRNGSAQHPLDIEKVETQRDDGGAVPASRPTTLHKSRTKSSRKEGPPAPVGFWHWQMVRLSDIEKMENGRLIES